jgi:hypothetical protein
VPSAQTQSIDQLMAHLNDLRARKAKLDKQEREVIAALKEKLKEQSQKLQKLGIVPDGVGQETPPLPPIPPVTGTK